MSRKVPMYKRKHKFLRIRNMLKERKAQDRAERAERRVLDKMERRVDAALRGCADA